MRPVPETKGVGAAADMQRITIRESKGRALRPPFAPVQFCQKLRGQTGSRQLEALLEGVLPVCSHRAITQICRYPVRAAGRTPGEKQLFKYLCHKNYLIMHILLLA